MEVQIKPGYKQTEVRIIPEDWSVLPLSELSIKIQDGTHFSPKLGGNDYLYITSKNIKNGFLDLSNVDYISLDEHKKIYRRCDVRYGDLLLTKDGVNTGNAAINKLCEEFSLLSSVAFVRFDNSKYDNRFFLQQILSHDGQKRINDAMSGNAITRLTLKKINHLLFYIPPTLAEQERIANALSDVDGLIEGLQRLIDKKKLMKQGAMQRLLNPYENGQLKEGWEVKRLGDIGTFSKGSGVKKEHTLSGQIPCIRYGEIYTRHDNYIRYFYSFISKEVAAEARLLSQGDILFACSGETKEEIGKCVAFTDKFSAYVGGDIIVLSPYKNIVSSLFLGYYLNTKDIVKQKSSRGQGDAVVHINSNALATIKMFLPPLDEQEAIVTTLSDMDAEIEALEAKLAKYRQIKQGMMQELLTGKTRLVASSMAGASDPL